MRSLELLRSQLNRLPEDAKAVNRANNHGIPLVIEAPTAKVSKMLAHKSVKITEKYYSPWVPERQAALERRMTKAISSTP